MTTIGSLFTGYGGLDLAVENVFSACTAWVSDIEPGPQAVLAHRFPDARQLGDITAVDWGDVEPVDIITGGSPCQDISAAGRRAGMTDGTRSNLWAQMREAIRVIRPSFVIWENVRGAHSARATSDLELEPGRVGGPDSGPFLRATGRVLGDLSGLGYDAEWVTLPASKIGAPHRRERVFVFAWRRVDDPSNLARTALRRRDDGHAVSTVSHPLLPTPRVSDYAGPGAHGSGGMDLRTAVAAHLLPTPRASDGEKGGPNQRGSRGDLTISSAVHQLLPTPRATRGGSATETVELLPTPKAGDADFGLPRTSGRPPEKSTHLATRLHYTDFGVYSPAVQRWEAVIGRPAPAPTELNAKGRPRLSPAFVEWMMGLPAGWVTDPSLGLSRVQQLRLLGNGVVPQQAEHALRLMLARSSGGAS